MAKQFFGNVCKAHPELGGKRYGSGECVGCVREKQKAKRASLSPEQKLAKSRAKYAMNKEATIAAQKKYREENAEAISARRKKRYLERSETIKARVNSFREANKDEINAKRRERYAQDAERVLARNAAWKKRNTSKARAAVRAWFAANPEARARLSADRKAAEKSATPAWVVPFFMREAYRLAKLREKVCGGRWHVDHIVPLQSKIVCGLHCEANLRVIPEKENISKGNRHWPGMP